MHLTPPPHLKNSLKNVTIIIFNFVMEFNVFGLYCYWIEGIKKCIYIRTWPSLSITISFQPSCCLTHNILSYFFAVKDKRCLQMCIYIEIYKGKHWQFLSLLHERTGALLGKAAEERMCIKNISTIREEKWVDEPFLEGDLGAFLNNLVMKI